MRPLGPSPAISQGDEVCCSTSGPQLLTPSTALAPTTLYIPPLFLTSAFNGSAYSSFCGCSLSLYTFSYHFHGFNIHYQASFLTCNPVLRTQAPAPYPNISQTKVIFISMTEHYPNTLLLLVLQSVSKLLLIFHKGKSTSTSGESTM